MCSSCLLDESAEMKLEMKSEPVSQATAEPMQVESTVSDNSASTQTEDAAVNEQATNANTSTEGVQRESKYNKVWKVYFKLS